VKILVSSFAYNEGEKIRRVISRHPKDRNYDFMVMDDGSTDGSLSGPGLDGVIILRNETNQGIGFAMKKVFQYAIDNNYDILGIQAGNDKDDPLEFPRLIDPIVKGEADFVQGSRFLPGGGYGNTPAYRIVATKIVHPLLFSVAVGKRLTETTNGFRAFRVSLLKDERINWRQDWLNKYELEPYLMYKVIKLGYKHAEAPCTKVYPPHHLGYTKMKPFSGWWSIMRPIVYLGFGIKK